MQMGAEHHASAAFTARKRELKDPGVPLDVAL
jgi:hypothetical protein